MFLAKKEHQSQLDVAAHLLDHQNPIHHLKECGLAKGGTVDGLLDRQEPSIRSSP